MLLSSPQAVVLHLRPVEAIIAAEARAVLAEAAIRLINTIMMETLIRLAVQTALMDKQEKEVQPIK